MHIPTPIIKVIPQRHTHDCAVACIAMLCGVSYEVALLAFESKVILSAGTNTKTLKAAAVRLGRALRSRRKFDIETDTGILAVRSKTWKVDHVVVLKDGLIIETDSTVWDADVYFAAHQAEGYQLFTLEDA